MAKILHTSDLHLQQYGDERWQTLKNLLEIGEKEEIDILVISGDLFDHTAGANILRSKIRQLFTHTGFQVVVIPGNHDRHSFADGFFFGEDVTVLKDFNNPLEYKDVVIWGLPFEPLEEIDVLKKLYSLSYPLPKDKYNILVYHGELLDAFFSRGELGDEGIQSYMPLKLSYFSELGFTYVLAGHLHSSYKVWQIKNGGFFVYPGSPVSITRKERGQRSVNLFYSGSPPSEYMIDSFHYDDVVLELDPFDAQDPINMVENQLQSLHPQAQVEFKVTGFINSESLGMSESWLAEEVKRLALNRGNITVVPEFKDIREILEDKLTKNFIQKLEEKIEDQEMKRRMRQLAIRAMLGVRI